MLGKFHSKKVQQRGCGFISFSLFLECKKKSSLNTAQFFNYMRNEGDTSALASQQQHNKRYSLQFKSVYSKCTCTCKFKTSRMCHHE